MYKKNLGTVIHGLGKGKDLGFPTANIKLNDKELYIDKGVYAVTVTLDCQTYKGMLYVGTRPTLDLQEITIEIHILEFNEDIYNMQIFFQIVQKIRNEVQFGSIDELIEQLHRDREMVYNFFQNQ